MLATFLLFFLLLIFPLLFFIPFSLQMTVDEVDMDDSFHGLMKGLNLDSQFGAYETEFTALDFPALSALKVDLEAQLGILFNLLHNKYGVDMQTPLVCDGFPRSDIDVVSVRLIRVKIIRVRNDHKRVLLELEQKMIAHFQLQRAGGDNTMMLDVVQVAEMPISLPTNVPFALIQEVASGSPAEASGLRNNDKLVRFGDVTATNHNRLQAIPSRVKANVPVAVEVVRDDEMVELTLTPRVWAGRGVLGCRLVPI